MIREVSHHLSEAQLLLVQLRQAAHSDWANPQSFALLLRRAVESRAWEGDFSSFRAYLDAKQPRGLEMTEDQFRHAAALAGVEDQARQLLLEEVPAAANQGYGPGRGHKKDDTTKSFVPQSAGHIVARLKRDDPTEANRVIRGEISADAAAKAKGWRKPRIVLSTPQRIAVALRRHLTEDQLSELAQLIGWTE